MPIERYVDYDPFADVYNRRWGGFADRILPVLDRLVLDDLPPGARILDLCCGTGQLAASLTERGFAVVGVDGSDEMISHARRNAPAAEFHVADARGFELDGPVAAAVSTFDSLNHIMAIADLRASFGCVSQSLEPGGRFVFDLNLDEGYRTRWRGSFGIVDDSEVVVAQSSYDETERIGRMAITVMTPADGDLWQRTAMAFTQRAHPSDDVVAALVEVGFTDVEMRSASDVGIDDVGRAFFICNR